LAILGQFRQLKNGFLCLSFDFFLPIRNQDTLSYKKTQKIFLLHMDFKNGPFPANDHMVQSITLLEG